MISLNVTKLAKFFDKEIKDSKNLLIVLNNGTYQLFGRYKIEPNSTYCEVYDTKTKQTVQFSTLKYATAWCILTDSNKFVESRRLQLLDLKLCSLDTDMQIHRKMLKSSCDLDAKLLYSIKLQEDSYNRRIVIKEIDTYINNSKTLQDRNFAGKKERNFKCL